MVRGRFNSDASSGVAVVGHHSQFKNKRLTTFISIICCFSSGPGRDESTGYSRFVSLVVRMFMKLSLSGPRSRYWVFIIGQTGRKNLPFVYFSKFFGRNSVNAGRDFVPSTVFFRPTFPRTAAAVVTHCPTLNIPTRVSRDGFSIPADAPFQLQMRSTCSLVMPSERNKKRKKENRPTTFFVSFAVNQRISL